MTAYHVLANTVLMGLPVAVPVAYLSIVLLRRLHRGRDRPAGLTEPGPRVDR